MEYLQLNSIRHFSFCKRQWGLINIEQGWEENEHTIIGNFIHRNVDDIYYREKRKDIIYVRAMPISSETLGLNGIIDLVEYRKSKEGVIIPKYEGYWKPYIVEYKKGTPNTNEHDLIQLVAQAICLEEKNVVKIDESAIYYKTVNKREVVYITDELREKVISMSKEMHYYFNTKTTPKAERGNKCKPCSLREICFPRLTTHKKSVINYINLHLQE